MTIVYPSIRMVAGPTLERALPDLQDDGARRRWLTAQEQLAQRLIGSALVPVSTHLIRSAEPITTTQRSFVQRCAPTDPWPEIWWWEGQRPGRLDTGRCIDTEALVHSVASDATAMTGWLPSSAGDRVALWSTVPGDDGDKSVLIIVDPERDAVVEGPIDGCEPGVLAWLANGAYLVASHGGSELHRREPESGRDAVLVTAPDGQTISVVAVSPDQTTVVTGTSDDAGLSLSVAPLTDPSSVRLRTRSLGAYTQVRFDRSGRLMVLEADGTNTTLFALDVHGYRPDPQRLVDDAPPPGSSVGTNWNGLVNAVSVGDRILAVRTVDGVAHVTVHGADGSFWNQLPLGVDGWVHGVEPGAGSTVWLTVSNPAWMPRLVEVDLRTGRVDDAVDPAVPPSLPVSVEHRVCSGFGGDATPSVHIVRRSDRSPTGLEPVLIVGAATAKIHSLGHDSAVERWVENGGIAIVANVAEADASPEDEFVAVAKWLVHQRMAQPGRIAIMGVTNAVLAAATQDLRLFGAAIALSPGQISGRSAQLDAQCYIGDPSDYEPNVAPTWREIGDRLRRTRISPPLVVFTCDTADDVDAHRSWEVVATLQAGAPRYGPILLVNTSDSALPVDSAVLTALQHALKVDLSHGARGAGGLS